MHANNKSSIVTHLEQLCGSVPYLPSRALVFYLELLVAFRYFLLEFYRVPHSAELDRVRGCKNGRLSGEIAVLWIVKRIFDIIPDLD